MVKNLGSFGVPILNFVGGERRTNQHFEVSEEVYVNEAIIGICNCTSF